MKTFEEALKRVPSCCSSAVESCLTDKTCEPLGSIIAGVEFELDLRAEGQDGCITAKERREAEKFLRWIKA